MYILVGNIATYVCDLFVCMMKILCDVVFVLYHRCTEMQDAIPCLEVLCDSNGVKLHEMMICTMYDVQKKTTLWYMRNFVVYVKLRGVYYIKYACVDRH